MFVALPAHLYYYYLFQRSYLMNFLNTQREILECSWPIRRKSCKYDRNDPKFSDRQVWANSVDPHQGYSD